MPRRPAAATRRNLCAKRRLKACWLRATSTVPLPLWRDGHCGVRHGCEVHSIGTVFRRPASSRTVARQPQGSSARSIISNCSIANDGLWDGMALWRYAPSVAAIASHLITKFRSKSRSSVRPVRVRVPADRKFLLYRPYVCHSCFRTTVVSQSPRPNSCRQLCSLVSLAVCFGCPITRVAPPAEQQPPLPSARRDCDWRQLRSGNLANTIDKTEIFYCFFLVESHHIMEPYF
eukprot:SAG31_NODE_508_length_14732_cov_75.624547_12_plen_232_part_00